MQAEIRPLPELVVNKIAAGEIIHRPANVIKELIENSLDAGATQITVSVADGGLRLIAVQDDGCGIKPADLDILCRRFTTSKLRQYEDLQTIGTFGFRGEALASVSHVSHLSVTTRCTDSQLAYRAEYLDGNLKDKPKACAGNKGTVIKVEKLFYCMPIRRKALKCAKEEYGKVLDVIVKYALHNPKVGFLLKRLNDQSASCTVDVRTTPGSALLNNLATLFGSSVVKDVMQFEVEDSKLAFSAKGCVSHPNYQGKKFILILFINERLVECDSLKKGLDLVTSQILPKGNRPFIYLSLKIKSQNVDVNVHPTKSEVHFLHENLIFKQIEEEIERKLLSCNESRTFCVQKIFGVDGVTNQAQISPVCVRLLYSDLLDRPSTSNARIYDHELVRTDSRKRCLEEFFVPAPLRPAKSVSITLEPMPDLDHNQISKSDLDVEMADCSVDLPSRPQAILQSERRVRNLMLASVENLKQEMIGESSTSLKALFKDHTMVGSIDAKLTLIQHDTNLYLVDTTKLSEQFFYQLVLNHFGNIGMYRFKKPVNLSNVLMLSDEITPESTTNHSAASSARIEKIIDILISNAPPLMDYFSIEIDAQDRALNGIPDLLDGFIPQLEKLPGLLINLAEQTDWLNEKRCFKSVCQHLARFFALDRKFCHENWSSRLTFSRVDWKWSVESLLYPAMKVKDFRPPTYLVENGVLRLLAGLHDLYKVFERC